MSLKSVAEKFLKTAGKKLEGEALALTEAVDSLVGTIPSSEFKSKGFGALNDTTRRAILHSLDTVAHSILAKGDRAKFVTEALADTFRNKFAKGAEGDAAFEKFVSDLGQHAQDVKKNKLDYTGGPVTTPRKETPVSTGRTDPTFDVDGRKPAGEKNKGKLEGRDRDEDIPANSATQNRGGDAYRFATELLATKWKNGKDVGDFNTFEKAYREAGKIFDGPAEELKRKPFSNLTAIAKAIQKNETITFEELTRLRQGNPNAHILTQAPSQNGSWYEKAAQTIVRMATQAVPATYNFYRAPIMWDGLKGAASSRVIGTAIGLGVLAGGSYEYSNFDARGLGSTSRNVLNAALTPIDILPTGLEGKLGKETTEPLADQTYTTLVSQGLSTPRFIEYTKDLTGIDLSDKKFKDMSPDSLDTMNLFIQIATRLQKTEGRVLDNEKGYNDDTLQAYKGALVANLGLRGGEKAESFNEITKQLQGRYEQAVANALFNPNTPTPVDIANKKLVLSTFLGTDAIPDDKNLVKVLVERFADPAAGGMGAVALMRPAIGRALVANGVTGDKDGNLSVDGAQKYLLALKTNTQSGVDIAVKTAEANTAETSRTAEQLEIQAMEAAAARKYGGGGAAAIGSNAADITAPRAQTTPAPAPVASKKSVDVGALFKDIAADPDNGLSGQDKALTNLFKAASAQKTGPFDMALFLRGLNQLKPTEEGKTAVLDYVNQCGTALTCEVR